jgi:hypothetical protein
MLFVPLLLKAARRIQARMMILKSFMTSALLVLTTAMA